jgi:proteasome assembly chaperone (PAC2) family protein
MWEKMDEVRRPELNDPVLLVALSTSLQQYRVLYSHAKELGKFMLKKMDFEKFATLYSSSLPPLVAISDEGILRLYSASFYHHPGERDIVLLTGDASPVDDQYEFCQTLLKYAQGLGIREMISVGTRWAEEAGSPTATPKVKGFSTDEKGVRELKSWGVEVIRDEPAPYFASLIIALAGRYGIRGYKISVDHGEPIPHPRSVAEMMTVLQKILGFKVDTRELKTVAEKMAANLEPTPGVDIPQRRGGIYG